MFDALWIATTGMKAQEFRTQTIANNMANASTTGFKRDMAHFSDLHYQLIRGTAAKDQGGDSGVASLYVGAGVEVDGTSKIFTQGDVQLTGEPLDVAIRGAGFFGLVRPDPATGTYITTGDPTTDPNLYFTRDGHFKTKSVNGDGTPPFYVVNSNGWALADETGNPVVLDPTINGGTNVSIGTLEVLKNGVIQEIDPALTANSPTGGPYDLVAEGNHVGNFMFTSPNGLIPIGSSTFQNDLDSTGGLLAGQPDLEGHGHLKGGSLEASNVETIDEMVNLIEAQRGYEMGSKVIEKADQMMSTLIQRT